LAPELVTLINKNILCFSSVMDFCQVCRSPLPTWAWDSSLLLLADQPNNRFWPYKEKQMTVSANETRNQAHAHYQHEESMAA
jgi:hypothetical protein